MQKERNRGKLVSTYQATVNKENRRRTVHLQHLEDLSQQFGGAVVRRCLALSLPGGLLSA